MEDGVPGPKTHKVELSRLFPKLINSAAVRLEPCGAAQAAEGKTPLTVGIVLSGGQAPGILGQLSELTLHILIMAFKSIKMFFVDQYQCIWPKRRHVRAKM